MGRFLKVKTKVKAAYDKIQRCSSSGDIVFWLFVMFINGVGKIKLQMYSAFLGSAIFIVSSIVMIKYFDWGIKSLLIAMIFSNFNGLILAPIQYNKIINNKATGIWNQ